MRSGAVVAVVFFMNGATALAQDVAPELPAVPPAPALEVPVAAVPAETPVSDFPKLPVSTPCKLDQVRGIWKLVKVYEQPQGPHTVDFVASPIQFLHLSRDTTYRIVKREQDVRNRRQFDSLFKRTAEEPLQQYLLHEKGFLYFYNEGVAVDTQACFIVNADLDEFKKGQLLLMPPAPAAGQKVTTRLLKVYKDITPGRNKPKKRK